MKKTPISGLGYLFKGIALITKPGLRIYVTIPLLINSLLFGIGIWYGYGQVQLVMEKVSSFLPEWLAWLSWLLIPLFIIATVVLLFFTFTIVANLISAPFNSLLAEKVEELLTGEKLPQGEGGWQRIIKDTLPLIMNEIGKIGYFLAWTIPLLILFIIPVVNIAAPFIWLVFSAWMLVVQYADVPMANHELSGKEIRRRLKTQRFTSLAFGGGVLMMTMVPVLNFISMPVAVAGATAMWVDRLKGLETPQ
ncbi:MAG: sulfate transporter CysZ [Magnetococcales bacterium]|nr:sulfate transporter CysZ [Magnetococcales bacterium]